MIEKLTNTKEKVSKSTLDIVKLEDESVIVIVQGWRMRVYFEPSANKDNYSVGHSVELEYYGSIDKPHEIRFLKIK